MPAHVIEDAVECRRVMPCIADEDAEAITVQMARTQLVGVPAHIQDADAVALELVEPSFDHRRHRHHLAGHGAAILKPRSAHLAGRDVQPPRDLPLKVFRAHVAFLDPQVEEVPLS